jgi:hypothetical protein
MSPAEHIVAAAQEFIRRFGRGVERVESIVADVGKVESSPYEGRATRRWLRA